MGFSAHVVQRPYLSFTTFNFDHDYDYNSNYNYDHDHDNYTTRATCRQIWVYGALVVILVFFLAGRVSAASLRPYLIPACVRASAAGLRPYLMPASGGRLHAVQVSLKGGGS